MCPGGGRAAPRPAPAGYWRGSDLLVGGLAGGVHAPMAQLPPGAGARLSGHWRGLGEEKRAALSQRGGTAGAARSRSPGERRPGRRGQLGPRAEPPWQCLVRRAPSRPGAASFSGAVPGTVGAEQHPRPHPLHARCAPSVTTTGVPRRPAASPVGSHAWRDPLGCKDSEERAAPRGAAPPARGQAQLGHDMAVPAGLCGSRWPSCATSQGRAGERATGAWTDTEASSELGAEAHPQTGTGCPSGGSSCR